MGEKGTKPFFMKVVEAAEILKGAWQLADREDCLDWMQIAFTIEQGRNKGLLEREQNPQYQRELNREVEKIAAAKPKPRGRR
jgi:hypothetical protein